MKESEKGKKFDPLVSVIVPLFNGSKYIEYCLRSILTQTYDKYEIIVINDGSTDDSIEKVENISLKFPDRIRILYHPDRGNHGIAASRNLGIKHAKGDYIAFLDQDDAWMNEKLKKQIDVLQKYPNTSLVYAKTMFIDADGKTLAGNNKYTTAGQGFGKNPNRLFKKIIRENFIPTLTVIVLRKCIIEYGSFDEGPRHEYEDWILWSKIAYSEKIAFIPEVLSKYRLHEENYSLLRLKSGLDTNAEEYYIVSLYKFLVKGKKSKWKDIKVFFRRSIFRFFVRARSWGLKKDELEKHKNRLLTEFPDGAQYINIAFMVASALNPGLLYIIRRVYRKIVGI